MSDRKRHVSNTPNNRVRSLTHHFKELLSSAFEAQRYMDDHYIRDSHALGHAAPASLRISRFEVDLNLLISSEERSGFRVGSRLGGRLTNAFLSLHYESSEIHRDRLKLTLVTVPAHSTDNLHPLET